MKEDILINVIQGWLGCKEGDATHKKIVDTYNNNRESGEYKMTYADPWCAAGIGAASAIAGLKGSVPVLCNCQNMINWFHDRNRIAPANSHPSKGWLVFYDWDGNKYSDHVGLVIAAQGNTFTTIECNVSDTVAYTTKDVGNPKIECFGVPDYIGSITSSVNYTSYFNKLSAADQKTISGWPVLQKGSKGVYVKVLQLILNAYSTSKLTIDGDFGDKTNIALHTYQISRKMEPDCVCGKETYSSFFA